MVNLVDIRTDEVVAGVSRLHSVVHAEEVAGLVPAGHLLRFVQIQTHVIRVNILRKGVRVTDFPFFIALCGNEVAPPQRVSDCDHLVQFRTRRFEAEVRSP